MDEAERMRYWAQLGAEAARARFEKAQQLALMGKLICEAWANQISHRQKVDDNAILEPLM